jgi:hypothetical protein
MNRNLLLSVVGGNAPDIVELRKHDYAAVCRVAKESAPEKLTLTREAVKQVLVDLLQKKISPEQAQLWASFVRRGYVTAKHDPIKPF